MESNTVFNKDFDAASVFVMKVYDADVSRNMESFYKAGTPDQWWAPKPWKCETQNLDFKKAEDGIMRWLAQETKKQYAGAEYHEITFHRSFDWTDFFTDAQGNQPMIFSLGKMAFRLYRR